MQGSGQVVRPNFQRGVTGEDFAVEAGCFLALTQEDVGKQIVVSVRKDGVRMVKAEIGEGYLREVKEGRVEEGVEIMGLKVWNLEMLEERDGFAEVYLEVLHSAVHNIQSPDIM
jgi:predicted peroxiredoxin